MRTPPLERVKIIVTDEGEITCGIKAGDHWAESAGSAIEDVFGAGANVMLRAQWEDRMPGNDSAIVHADTGKVVGFIGHVTETYLMVGPPLPPDCAPQILRRLSPSARILH